MDDFTQLSTQEQRELAQALAVQRMSAKERGVWFGQQLAIVQSQAQLMMQHFPARLGAISFASMAEKNRYDEQRELEQALHFSLAAQSRHAANTH